MSIIHGGRGTAPLVLAALVVVGSVVCATLAFAGPEWLEGGKKNGADAGSTPGNEDQPMGIGDMEAIRGTLRAFAQGTAAAGPMDFQDLYLICIEDPQAFLASTINPLNGYAEGFDSRLYLFDMNGNGLLSNDDTQLPLGSAGLVGGVVPESTMENTADDGTEVIVLESGLYLLGIGDISTAPMSKGGDIFFYESPTEVSGPDGPGGEGGPVEEWVPTGACCLPNNTCAVATEEICGLAGGDYQGDEVPCDKSLCLPTGACCLPDESCTISAQLECAQAGGAFQGVDTVCDKRICLPLGACCLQDDTCLQLNTLACDRAGGEYLGNGTFCDETTCLPEGACCLADNTCVVTNSLDCDDNGGEYQGDKSVCDPQLCLPIGACCLPDNSCADTDEASCKDTGGEYQGDRSMCDPQLCLPVGACCLEDFSCIDTDEDSCGASAGEYQGDRSACKSVECIPPTGACCLTLVALGVDQPCLDDLTEDECAATSGGSYQGDGTTCADTDIACAVGACCVDGKGSSCVDGITEAQCIDFYGSNYVTFQGGGTTCSDPGIDCPTGACCAESYGYLEGTGGGGPTTCLDDVLESACNYYINGVFQGAGSSCFDPDIDCPLGACCVTQLPDLVGGGGSGCFDNLTEDQCTSMGAYAIGVFQGPGSSCSDIDIDCPSGACCLNGGLASVGISGCIDNITEVECTGYYGASGVFQGAGTTCDDPGIDCPKGACCITDKYGTNCENGLTQAECEASYAIGVFLGVGSTCPNAACIVTGGCCLPDSSCVLTDEADCAGQGGDYQGDGSNCYSCYPTAGAPPLPGEYRIVLDGVCFAQSVPEGACDLPEGGCVITNEFNCVMVALGKFQGEGTFCQRNDNCDAAEPIVEGSTPFDTAGATTDGPPHAACERFGDDQINQDIWYDYIPGCDGTLTVSLCGSDFDTKLAIYEGCACPVGDFNLLNCDDDGCGPAAGPSTVTLPVAGDACYKVRIGGFSGEKGTGVAQVSLAPDEEQKPSLVLDVDPKVGYEVGGPYVVTLYADDLCGMPAAGFQAFLEYDPLAIEFQSATYTTTPFGITFITGSDINPTLGQLDVASGINQTIGQLPTSSPDRVDLVVLEFTALSCDAAVTFRKHVPPTRITDPVGNEIPANLIDTPVPQCPGDVNGDGEVGVSDLITTLNDWGTANCLTDANNDGMVNVNDLIDVIVNWGPCP